MERVTFRDPALSARVARTCVTTWKDLAPGFRIRSLEEPEFKGAGQCFLEQLTRSTPGFGSDNVAVVFSLPDGRVLHVAPGLMDARDLERELDFALELASAVNASAEESRRNVAAMHAARAESLPTDSDDARSRQAALGHVHETLAQRPLLPIDELRVVDYSTENREVARTLHVNLELTGDLLRAVKD